MKNIFLVFGVLSLSGCGDRDADDYHSARVAEEVSKMNVIAGNYSGDLIWKLDGTSLGRMSLELRPATRVVPSGSDVQNSQQAVLKGTLSLESDTTLRLPFSDGVYISNTGEFQLSILVFRRDTVEMVVDIIGQAHDGELTGVVQVGQYPERGGSFSLKRAQAISTKPVVIHDIAAVPDGKAPQIFTAVLPLNSGESKTDLIIWPQEANDVEKFLEIFVPIQLRDVSIIFGGVEERWDFVTFPNAIWDLRNGSLKGEISSNPRLQCSSVRLVNQDSGWKCNFYRNGTSFQGIIFQPKPNAALPSKG